MVVPPAVESFWAEFVRWSEIDPTPRFYEAFFFDDNEPSANELAELVVQGVKRATAASLWAYEAESKELPKPGHLSVVTEFSGKPVCVIETESVSVTPFAEVGATFAATEGEGDGSLAYWQEAHTAYFVRECARLGRDFSGDMPVVCEVFRVVFRASRTNAV